jgi:ribosome recycling factor
LSRQSPFSANWGLVTRKSDKGKKKRKDDDDDDWDDEDAPPAPTPKGGKPAKAAPSAPSTEFDPKVALVAFDAHLKKLQSDLSVIKLGKADPQMLSKIEFEEEPLIAIAQITVKDPTTLSVAPYDTSSLAKLIKLIQSADPSLTVGNDGKAIFVSVPKPTPEHKRNLAKQAATTTEKTKVDIRNTRRDLLDALKKMALPKDDNKIAEAQIQKAHDDVVKKVDAALKAKDQELSK